MPTTFFDLPPEIRNEIYCFIPSLTPTLFLPPTSNNKKTTYISNIPTRHGRIYIDCLCAPCAKHLKQPPITRVCRKLRQETLGVWYGVNGFYLSTSSLKCRAWFEALRPYRRVLREVQLGENAMRAGMGEVMMEILGKGGKEETEENEDRKKRLKLDG